MIECTNAGAFAGSGQRITAKHSEQNEKENIEDASSLFERCDSTAVSSNTKNEKVPFIIAETDKDALNRLKEKIYKNFSPEQVSIKEDLPLVDGLKVDISPSVVKDLVSTLPENARIAVDRKVFPDPLSLAPFDENRPSVNLDNSTLGISKLWDKGYTGVGVGIAVIDSGIYPHKDFDGRIAAFADMHEGKNKPYDPYGHGTHVAGIAAGSGAESAGKYTGVAPDADIIGVRITSVSEAIKGLQWVIENKEKYNIKVVNMSLGDFALKSYKDDVWAQAAEKAWNAGLVVICAAGNEGPGEGSISTPGIDPKVITVGSIDDRNTPDRSDDVIAPDSSRGPTSVDGIDKPDIAAPGVDIFGPSSPNSKLDLENKHHDGKYIAMSGTSMATPFVSGLAAVLLQANPELKPDELKQILRETADKYIPQAGINDQGAGVVDPVESLAVALGHKKRHSTPVPVQDHEMIIAGKKKKHKKPRSLLESIA